MKKLTKSQNEILSEFANLDTEFLALETPFHISRRAPCWFTWDSYEKEPIETLYIYGYARAADGLVQRGLLIRDTGHVRFWLTTFGIDYIKGLQR